MALFNSTDFLDRLVTYLAENATGGALPYASTPRAIWRYRADEDQSTDPYSVVQPFGGELPWVPAARISIQVMTTAKAPAAAHNRAQAIFGALCDAQGRPKRMIDLGGAGDYRLLGVSPKWPQAIGLDGNDRTQVAFNFDATAANVG